jgi:hypothetical protein
LNIIISVVFLGLIAAIALDVIDILVAALLGVCVLIIAGTFTQQDILNVTRVAGGPFALLFGGMLVARVLVPTGLFEYVGSRYLLKQGKRPTIPPESLPSGSATLCGSTQCHRSDSPGVHYHHGGACPGNRLCWTHGGNLYYQQISGVARPGGRPGDLSGRQ